MTGRVFLAGSFLSALEYIIPVSLPCKNFSDFAEKSVDNLISFLYNMVSPSLFAVILWVSWMQAPSASRVRCFRDHIPQVEVLKIGALDVGSKPLTLQGEASGQILSQFYAAVLGMGFMARVCFSLSFLFDVDFFSCSHHV